MKTEQNSTGSKSFLLSTLNRCTNLSELSEGLTKVGLAVGLPVGEKVGGDVGVDDGVTVG